MDLSRLLSAKSNIEWCEGVVSRYQYLEHVSEVGNTFTSLLYIVPALLMARRHRRHGLPFWFTYTEFWMCVVGLGSALFHGTESYLGEMLDEVPMSFLALGYLLQIENRHSYCMEGTASWWRIRAFAIGQTVLGWALYWYTHNFEIFKATFTVPLIIATVLLGTAKPPPQGRAMFYLQSVLAISGKTVWVLERYYYSQGTCPTDVWDVTYHLHSYWHIFGALAHYTAQYYQEQQALSTLKLKEDTKNKAGKAA
uniref:Alkaline ceramidase n=1 Tax=Phaeomonas parva TaxID=124430 RepID=A0A7S1UKI8_9STRA|mmetsp:Transcript_9974/g.29328  ORF Transcript_9974/g.29328 Transcript_9974/m.29328 type:complete len:253 (+) Transcript_9974:246-1004(+)